MGLEEQVTPVDSVTAVQRDGVVVITLDGEPSSALSHPLREVLSAQLAQAAADDDAIAVVITGGVARFATSADPGRGQATEAPTLAQLCDTIESFEKPVAVAVDGPALGAGLELALAAHLRVASGRAIFGAPDITVGLVPNAGGTQRLPKVIGGVPALKLLLSGKSVAADAAKKLGLVDVLVENDPTDAAVATVKHLSASEEPLRRNSERRDKLGDSAAFLEAVANFKKAAKSTPLNAPERMIECVEAALLLPYDIGRGLEEAAYDDLVASNHAQSLRYVSGAEARLQAATRREGRVPSRTVTGVTVVGARGLGAEVAVQCLDAGFTVTVAEVDEDALEEGTSRIIGHFDARVASGAMTEDAVEDVLDRMHALAGYHQIGEADVVIDPMQHLTKARVKALDAAMKAGGVLILGCERVTVGTVAAKTGRESDVVGMRFFPGVRRNRCVEFTATEATGPRAIATARALARKLDRLIVETGPSKTAIGTALLEALHSAADLCLEDGARLIDIDNALRGWGLPFGSFAWRDLTGVKRHSAPHGIEGQRGSGIDPVLVSVGRLGVSTGRGYYTYKQRGMPGVPDPEVESMIAADRAAKGITARTLSSSEIRERCVAALAGAGAYLLQDGAARHAEDIDMVAIHGLGFARHTGGVMFAADLIGLPRIVDLISTMSSQSARILPPPDWLQTLAQNNERLVGQV